MRRDGLALRVALLIEPVGLVLASCGAPPAAPPAAPPTAPAAPPSAAPPPSVAPGCRDAYAAYEVAWRTARTNELAAIGFELDLIEEIVGGEVASLPSREEVDKLRAIYAIVETFLWDAPWARALAAAEGAIERCGETAPRPPRSA